MMMVAVALGCWVICEQPKGSLMEMHPGFQEYLTMVQNWRATIQMGHYGAPSLKPTWLYSSESMIDQLHQYCPNLRPARDGSNVEMVVHYTNSAGEAKIKGGRDLKQSQSYPIPLLCLIPTVEF